MANTFSTVSTMTSVIKDAWTSQEIAKQFYDENPLLAKFRSFQATTIGLQAQVPIHKYNPGGYVSTDSAGGTIQDAQPAGVAQATYTMVYHWFQIALETGALNQTASNAQAVVAAKDLEMRGAVSAVSRQCSRQLAMDGTGRIAATANTASGSTLNLSATGLGYDAIVRGWLYPGIKIDVGTTADSDASMTGGLITGVTESSTAPAITVASAADASSSFVSIANPNSATASNPELNGLRNLVGTGSLGGINPATAGSEYWQSSTDTATTVLSLDLILNMKRAVQQKTGPAGGNTLVTSLKQQQNLYLLLQNQVRFGSDGAVSAGASNSVSWNGMEIMALNDIVDRDLYVLTLGDFVRVVGDITEPTWASDLEGAGGSFRWAQGTTGFVNGLVFPFQVGVQRRNSHAAATGLTA